MNILALDLATTTGWALSCGLSGTWNLKTRSDESNGMKLLRLRAKLREVHAAEPIQVVVLERPHSNPKMINSVVPLAHLHGVAMLFCEDNGIEYRSYSPSDIKKHATSKGNANKDAMVAAARQRWPHVTDDNEADALWLLDLAKKELGA